MMRRSRLFNLHRETPYLLEGGEGERLNTARSGAPKAMGK